MQYSLDSKLSRGQISVSTCHMVTAKVPQNVMWSDAYPPRRSEANLYVMNIYL